MDTVCPGSQQETWLHPASTSKVAPRSVPASSGVVSYIHTLRSRSRIFGLCCAGRPVQSPDSSDNQGLSVVQLEHDRLSV